MNESSEFFVGMDVHKDSISFAVLTETSPSPVLQVRKRILTEPWMRL
ncbi:hypothetical protein ES708_18795 [subsurface metagenome]